MADFDPDAYLAEKSKQEEFNPDAYLASEPSNFDPSAYLSSTAPNPMINLAPQGVSIAKAVVPSVIDAAQNVNAMNAAKGVTANIRDAGTIASILSKNASPEVINEFLQNPIRNTAKLAGAYVAGHPYLQAAGNVASGLRNIPGALVAGAVAPESVFMMPYQMAAAEQEKIRQNPYAPGLENNPYAQTVRGEYATQGQAGAANTRRAIINQPFGNVTAEERKLLENDRQRKLQLMVQYEAAKKILGQ